MYTIKLININVYKMIDILHEKINQSIINKTSNKELRSDDVREKTVTYSFEILASNESDSFYFTNVSDELLKLIPDDFYVIKEVTNTKNMYRIPIDIYANYDFESELYMRYRGFLD